MKKFFALAALSSLALMGCDAQDANAQATQSASVGNPDSANVLIVEEGYEVVAPATGSVNYASPAQSADWSQEGNVDVAPLPVNGQQPAAAAGNNHNAATGNNTAAPAAGTATQGTVNVDESVLETATPNSATYQVDETIAN